LRVKLLKPVNKCQWHQAKPEHSSRDRHRQYYLTSIVTKKRTKFNHVWFQKKFEKWNWQKLEWKSKRTW
jgi:hypothetical protein